ncbi:MAG: hypothetical protein ACI9OJ_005484, partial [Myxococcota bacterium]
MRPIFPTSCCVLLVIATLALGCTRVRPAKVPGETDVRLKEVRFVAKSGGDLQLESKPVVSWLGQRAGGFIQTDRFYNRFRVNEDQRRVTAYWQNHGYFDVVVTPAEPEFEDTDEGRLVILTWMIDEGARSTIASITLRHFPTAVQAACEAMVDFSPGDAVDLNVQRMTRWNMATVMQEAGFAHAKVYSRAFVDRKTRTVNHFFYADPGPKTRIKSVRVVGSVAVDEADIIRRTGFEVGDDWSKAKRDAGRLALLDTGAFFNVAIDDDADVILNIGIPPPDSGGFIDDERVQSDGTLTPREVPEALDVVIVVVESPALRTRIEVGAEFDADRLDGFGGVNLIAPNALGSMHHLTAEARVGYGYLWDSATADPVDGLYGGVLLRSNHPGLIGRLGDFRLTGEYQERLVGESASREITAGPGLRATLAPGLYFDVDLLYLFSQERAYGPFDAATRSRFPEFTLS